MKIHINAINLCGFLHSQCTFRAVVDSTVCYVDMTIRMQEVSTLNGVAAHAWMATRVCFVHTNPLAIYRYIDTQHAQAVSSKHMQQCSCSISLARLQKQ